MLELIIAMTFVGLLAAGIVITISTALRVWNRAMRMADLHQEARSVMALLTRDIRGAYLGLPPRDAGYFFGSLPESGATQNAAPPIDTLELTTESSSISEVALLPDEVRQDWDQRDRPPVSDLLGVRWEWRPAQGRRPEGLYRTASVAPAGEPEIDLDTGEQVGLVADELVSTAASELRFRYFDGQEWQESWDARQHWNSLPAAVSIALTLSPETARERTQDYTFETVVTLAAH